MKRKFLEDLGLEKDIVDKIMAENGNDINAEKAKVNDKVTEIDNLKEKLEEANNTISSYKDMDIEEIKKAASEWEGKYQDSLKEIESMKNNSILNKELGKLNSIDEDVLSKLINRDELKFEDGKVIGLDEQVKSLKESKPYLFKDDDLNGFSSHIPEGSSGNSNSMLAEIDSIFEN